MFREKHKHETSNRTTCLLFISTDRDGETDETNRPTQRQTDTQTACFPQLWLSALFSAALHSSSVQVGLVDRWSHLTCYHDICSQLSCLCEVFLLFCPPPPQCSWIGHQQVRSSARPQGVAEPTPCWRRSYLETWRGSVTRRPAHGRKLPRSSIPKRRRWEGCPNYGSGSQRRTMWSNLRIRAEGRTVWWSLRWNMCGSNFECFCPTVGVLVQIHEWVFSSSTLWNKWSQMFRLMMSEC